MVLACSVGMFHASRHVLETFTPSPLYHGENQCSYYTTRHGRSQDNCTEITLIKQVRSTDRDRVILLRLDSPVRSCLPLRRALPEYLQETS